MTRKCNINNTINITICLQHFNITNITTKEDSTAYFACTTGVRQGENLSPFLFNIYLNDLEAYLDDQNVPGIDCQYVNEELSVFFKLFLVLYAGDTVLLSDSKTDLQYA